MTKSKRIPHTLTAIPADESTRKALDKHFEAPAFDPNKVGADGMLPALVAIPWDDATRRTLDAAHGVSQ